MTNDSTTISPEHLGTPIHATAEQLETVKYGADGLVVAIVQELSLIHI